MPISCYLPAMQKQPEAMTSTTVESTGRPVLIRHHTSGVWVGYLVGGGTVPDSIEIVGRRIWSWHGGALECGALALRGATNADNLGPWEVVEIGSISTQLVEIRTIQDKIVRSSREARGRQG